MLGTVLGALWLLFSHPVVSDSFQPHGLQHARLPCPSPSPEVCPLSCPLHWWCHPLILWCRLLPLPSIIPSIRVFSNESAVHIRWPKYWSFSISPSNKYSGLTSLKIDCLISYCPRDLQESSPAPQFKGINSLVFCLLYSPALTTVRDHWKTIVLTIWIFAGRVISLLFNTLSRFVMVFLPGSNCLLISWLQSPSTVILEPKEKEMCHTSTFKLYY